MELESCGPSKLCICMLGVYGDGGIKTPVTSSLFRPDSIDLLFLGSFPNPFKGLRGLKIKIKGKRGKNLHENTII